MPSSLPTCDKKTFAIFDAADALTAAREELGRAMAEGFLALARERYQNPGAHLRLSSLLYDGRADLKAGIRLKFDENDALDMLENGESADNASDADASGGKPGLRKRKGVKEGLGKTKQTIKSDARKVSENGMFGAVPSTEMRNMKRWFDRAAKLAVEVANCERRVGEMVEDCEDLLVKEAAGDH